MSGVRRDLVTTRTASEQNWSRDNTWQQCNACQPEAFSIRRGRLTIPSSSGTNPIDGLDPGTPAASVRRGPALRRPLPGMASNEKRRELRQGHVLNLLRPLTASTRTCPGHCDIRLFAETRGQHGASSSDNPLRVSWRMQLPTPAGSHWTEALDPLREPCGSLRVFPTDGIGSIIS